MQRNRRSDTVRLVRLLSLVVLHHRTVEYLEFDAGPITVLFGKNNVGKTSILEAITSAFTRGAQQRVSVREGNDWDYPQSALHFGLSPGVTFDDQAAAAFGSVPPPGEVTFLGSGDRIGQVIGPPQVSGKSDFPWLAHLSGGGSFEEGFIGGGPALHVLWPEWEVSDLERRVEKSLEEIDGPVVFFGCDPKRTGPNRAPWLIAVDVEGVDQKTYTVHPEALRAADRLGGLATDLLPDFIDGSIDVEIVDPMLWVGDRCRVAINYVPRDERINAHAVSGAGQGPGRWMAAAVQIALHLLCEHRDLVSSHDPGPFGLSGHVLLIDEPEAHLHPSAVASIVRWCRLMAQRGFTLILASHHEQFLRAEGDEFRLVNVRRDPETGQSTARTVSSAATPVLQELANEVGVHPAVALSLRRAILFVEGPLDEAVLDEYAGPQLDAAGILIVPIHGTKNLEGLIDGEFATRLGIKVGVLTDNTVTSTMWDRSNSKRSSEEKKLVKLIQRYEDLDAPVPKLFGVPEDDLLFALPPDAIGEHIDGRFPGWEELVDECRTAEARGKSDSVNWKSYAEKQYGLSIATADGVRRLVRELDLAGVELPSIRRVVDEILAWSQ